MSESHIDELNDKKIFTLRAVCTNPHMRKTATDTAEIRETTYYTEEAA